MNIENSSKSLNLNHFKPILIPQKINSPGLRRARHYFQKFRSIVRMNPNTKFLYYLINGNFKNIKRFSFLDW